jgi:hypothetical protein
MSDVFQLLEQRVSVFRFSVLLVALGKPANREAPQRQKIRVPLDSVFTKI